MTKNEQIASIMLEAADLLKNDELSSLTEEAVYSPSIAINEVLTEAAEYGCEVDTLLEAAEDISAIEKEVADIKDEKDEKKLKDKVNKILAKITKWYYKVEPNKKFKLLRKVLKLLNSINYQIISKILGLGVINRMIYAKSKAANVVGAVSHLGVMTTPASSSVAGNKMLKDMENSFNVNLPRVKTGSIIMSTISAVITQIIYTALPGIYASGQYEYNIKDFDANLDELNKAVKNIDDSLSKLKDADKESVKSLLKAKKNYQKAIAELTKEKVKYAKLKDSKISARGAAIRKNEDKKQALKETVDFLYNEAVLCEDAEVASAYVEKAQRLESLLDESAGQNGLRRRDAKESLKNAQKQLDDCKNRGGCTDMWKSARNMSKAHYEMLNDDYKKARRNEDSLGFNKSTADMSKKNNAEYNYEHNNLSNKSKKLHEKINSRAKLNEAIDFLYNQAILCEDAEDALAYVEKAEELQKAIENIPEEKPVQQDEYNTAVVGGDDQDPELEEIKDLCDNDPDVVKLLTDDEDKSVTVD